MISQAQLTLSSTDHGKHRKKGFKTSIILVSSVTGIGVKFLPWKKQRKLCMKTNFWSFFSLQISMLSEKIFVLLISQPVKGKTFYYICYRQSSEFSSSRVELPQIGNRGLPVQQNIALGIRPIRACVVSQLFLLIWDTLDSE